MLRSDIQIVLLAGSVILLFLPPILAELIIGLFTEFDANLPGLLSLREDLSLSLKFVSLTAGWLLLRSKQK